MSTLVHRMVPKIPSAVAVNEKKLGVMVCRFMGEFVPFYASKELSSEKNHPEFRRLYRLAVKKLKAGQFTLKNNH